MNCPKCGKKHRSFPVACFYAAQDDHLYCVIAKQAAGNGTPIFDNATELRLAKIWSEYVKLKGFDSDPRYKK